MIPRRDSPDIRRPWHREVVELASNSRDKIGVETSFVPRRYIGKGRSYTDTVYTVYLFPKDPVRKTKLVSVSRDLAEFASRHDEIPADYLLQVVKDFHDLRTHEGRRG